MPRPHGPEEIAPSALITGITGQDGSYLAELLLEKGYRVHGLIRRSSSLNTERIDHILPSRGQESPWLTLHHGDLGQGGAAADLVRMLQPDEVYNLAAQSHVRVSFDLPEYTADVVGLGPLRLLEAIRQHSPGSRLYQASSSEMFGRNASGKQDENTPFHPVNPYGCAKAFAHWATRSYREGYGLFAVNGILFNHESPRRGATFLTRKTTRAVARIKLGRQEKLDLGNLDARRDWGYAPDYVEAMWLMMQQHEPDDYVIATGETHSVREFVEAAFHHAGIDLEWHGTGPDEKGIDRATGRTRVEIDPRCFRPVEIDVLCGDAERARRQLGWRPRVGFEELVRIMVDADLRALEEHSDCTLR